MTANVISFHARRRRSGVERNPDPPARQPKPKNPNAGITKNPPPDRFVRWGSGSGLRKAERRMLEARHALGMAEYGPLGPQKAADLTALIESCRQYILTTKAQSVADAAVRLRMAASVGLHTETGQALFLDAMEAINNSTAGPRFDPDDPNDPDTAA